MQAHLEPLSFYEVLGVLPTATPDEIRKAYHAAVRDSHPDKDGLDGAQFIAQRRAWETLRDETLRHEYDVTLALKKAAAEGSRILEDVSVSEAGDGLACRCGGVASVDSAAGLPQIIACDGCSLEYRVVADAAVEQSR